MYCRDCGKEIIDKSTFCNHCGAKVTEAKSVEKQVPTKTKTSAVVLSVLFGFFGWLYTYKKNKGKFWITLSITLFLLIINVLSSDLVIGIFINIFSYIFGFGVFIWVIIDNATKPNEYFENYTN